MKKMMKKLFALAMTAVMSVGMLTACGGGKDSSAEDGKIKITVSISGTDASEGALMQKWKQAYEAKNENIFFTKTKKIDTKGPWYQSPSIKQSIPL